MNARRLAFFVMLALLLAATAAGAQTFALGPGTSVQRVRYRSRRGAGGWQWVPQGFSFAGNPMLAYTATLFAGGPDGRIFTASAGRIAWTEDRGATWIAADMDPSVRALNALSFDEGSGRGVAVGDGGTMWVTGNGGQSWQLRRDAGAADFVGVCALGSIAVLRDSRGAAFVADLSGSTFQPVREPGGLYAEHVTDVVRDRGALWIAVDGELRLRVDASGSVEAIAH